MPRPACEGRPEYSTHRRKGAEARREQGCSSVSALLHFRAVWSVRRRTVSCILGSPNLVISPVCEYRTQKRITRNPAMQIGIIGLPNSGKTTIFNALTRSDTATAAFSSGQVEVHTAVVDVPDVRVDRLSA
ncbi:MAG: 50S ribosome-binding GTPase, partial [Caldilineaceae bacterium]|nr:50S ribosome-binding GTPase [Caldilineaceae bacterium]